MVEKKGFFQRKKATKTSESSAMTIAQQIEEIGRQVISLRQKLKVAEQEKEDITKKFDALKKGQLKESAALLDKKRAEFENTLAAAHLESEQKLTSLSQEMATKDERLDAAKVALQSKEKEVTKLTQEFETALATKASKIKALTEEKLEIKSQVSVALLELQEHFDYKTALLETERELLAQEKEKQEHLSLQNIEAYETFKSQTEIEAAQIIDTAKATAQQLINDAQVKNAQKEKQETLRLQNLEEREAIMRKKETEASQIIDTAKATAQQLINNAQAEIAEKEAQSREELNRLKGRIDHYSTQINAAAQTIDTLLGTISSL